MAVSQFSPTVERTRKELVDREFVTAIDIADSILAKHREYASGVSRIPLSPKSAPIQNPIDEWLSNVRDLFDQTLAPRINGRFVIIGLSMLDLDLKKQLEKSNFLSALVSELKEPLETLLSDLGEELWFSSNLEPNLEIGKTVDRVPNQGDDALEELREDQLGRAAFARFLAGRISSIDSKFAYAFHIYGPWGSGKSSLLNFLGDVLETDGWLVVNFNAWRSQHIRPPWWALLDKVFQEGKTKKMILRWDLINEYTWRLGIGRTYYYLAILLTAILSIILFMSLGENVKLLPNLSEIADDIGIVLATATALWAAFNAFSRAMFARSAKAAESYFDSATDPMGQITTRFKNLTNRIGGRKKTSKIAIFIDDLDRCKSEYVVGLLEGIQTLFRDSPNVLFVVAADRRWLNACFETVYSQLKIHVQEPGKPLGALFLEKVFQFSTPVPGIPVKMRETYWKYLLKMNQGLDEESIVSARAGAIDRLRDKAYLSDHYVILRDSQERKESFAQQQALREETIVNIASQEVSLQIEKHTLSQFATLLEPNPRAMKRLVNAYSVNSALSILGYLDIPQEKLALWTIITMRWPSLARHLSKKPSDFLFLLDEKAPESEIESSAGSLFTDPEVINVINGGETGVSLDVETLKDCAKLGY